jgi:hypothetical protein
MYPSNMQPGKRSPALHSLALRASMLGKSRRNLSLYEPGPAWYGSSFFALHQVYVEVRALLNERNRIVSEFDFELAAALMDRHPRTYLESDFNLAVRALWKSDRVGFHKGGTEAFRDGFIAALIRHWDDPVLSLQVA